MTLKDSTKKLLVINKAELLLFISTCIGTVSLTTLAADVTMINQTKSTMAESMRAACVTEDNKPLFQERCSGIMGAAGGPDEFILPEGNVFENNAIINGINQIAPEQAIVPSIQATRTMQSIMSIANAAVVTRLQVLRAGLHQPSATHYASSSHSFRNRNPGQLSFAFRPVQSGGAAGMGSGSRLGIWGNANYAAGDVDTSRNQLGFGFDNWGGTIGADYRIFDTFVVGAAFSYSTNDTNINNSGSTVKSDFYTGSIFSSYTHESGFYVDGIASYGGGDYDITRMIQYSIGGGDAVDAVAKGNPGSSQFSAGATIGYQFNIGATTIEPFARANYQELEINGYEEIESGVGQGWGMRFSKQHVRSLPTSVGLRLSQAISTTWGVLQPQIHGAWFHEFKDKQRIIEAQFLGANPAVNGFNILTESPDRDYFTVGASLSATLPHGYSAFIGYNTLLGYQNITSHRVVFGGRMEF